MTAALLTEAQAERIAFRALEDALTEAWPAYWWRRAQTLEAARHQPGDYRGRATDAELRARDARLAADAERCRQHAVLVGQGRPWWLSDVVEGVASWV